MRIFTALILAILSAPVVDAATCQQDGRVKDAAATAPPTQAMNPMALRALVFGTSLASQSINPSNFGATQQAMSGITFSVIRSLAPQSNSPLAVPAAGWGGTSLILRITVTATGASEFFTLHVPPTPVGVPRPLLVAFHSFGVSHLEIAGATTFLDEARQRDWFMIAPYSAGRLGGGQTSYGSVDSQLHVKAVIDLITRNYDIDLDRIYGVGFSMGGGAAMSYAARHRDRSEGAFAAVVNHTGTISLPDVWNNALPSRAALSANIGTPTMTMPPVFPFDYFRTSVVELDAQGQLVPGGRHMAQNLASVPVRTSFCVADQLQYLVDQSMALDGFMQSLPGATHELLPVPLPPVPCPMGHCWASLDETAACDWLDQQTLQSNAASGAVLADRDGQWGMFDLAQIQPDSFSSLNFDVSTVQNAMTLGSLENVAQASFDFDATGLDRSAPFNLTLDATTTAAGREVVIDGVTRAPSVVDRNGLPAIGSCVPGQSFPAWCYDPAASQLRIWTPPAFQVSDWTIVL